MINAAVRTISSIQFHCAAPHRGALHCQHLVVMRKAFVRYAHVIQAFLYHHPSSLTGLFHDQCCSTHRHSNIVSASPQWSSETTILTVDTAAFNADQPAPFFFRRVRAVQSSRCHRQSQFFPLCGHTPTQAPMWLQRQLTHFRNYDEGMHDI
jgi:hypothetical protein